MRHGKRRGKIQALLRLLQTSNSSDGGLTVKAGLRRALATPQTTRAVIFSVLVQ